jgi:hypothetical protein
MWQQQTAADQGGGTAETGAAAALSNQLSTQHTPLTPQLTVDCIYCCAIAVPLLGSCCWTTAVTNPHPQTEQQRPLPPPDSHSSSSSSSSSSRQQTVCPRCRRPQHSRLLLVVLLALVVLLLVVWCRLSL